MKKTFCVLVALVSFIVTSKAQVHPPTVEWKKVTWDDENIRGIDVPQTLSGDEWWYSHKNLYSATNTQIGYVGVGYFAPLVHPGDENAIDTIYNDQLYYSNIFPPPVTVANTTNGLCEDLYKNSENRAEYLGKVARLDLAGNIIWYKNLCIGDLQEVIQVGNAIYVIGTHAAAKKLDKSSPVTFLNYNPTASHPDTVFNSSNISGPRVDGDVHMYVAKLDLNGNVLWESLYGIVDAYPTAQQPSGNQNAAWHHLSKGFDLMINSQDGNLYAVGSAFNLSSTNVHSFVVKIDPLTGWITNNGLDKSILPLPTNNNLYSQPYISMEGRSICEIGNTGKMVIGGKGDFPVNTSTYVDYHRGVIYSIDSNLALNTSWGTNPKDFSTSVGTDPAFSTPNKTTNIWEVAYHNANNEILVGLITNCDFCANSGVNSATGQVFRLNATNGSASTFGTNPSNMGPIRAFDLRIGVTETTDGGFAAVSTKRNGNFVPPTVAELDSFASCATLNYGY